MRVSDLAVVLPHLAAVVVEKVERVASGLRLHVRARSRRAACPRCSRRSSRVHSRYERRLTDAAVAGSPVELRLRVRRFFCDVDLCPARTFAEQIPGLTSKWARRSPLMRRSLEIIALALPGEPAPDWPC
ncbi:transposase family protein [Dactylosporangium sp. NPDC051484]|uniref:transposase family protein n=1 Tax=Dactylosporangium sp. NPDC051484 TaxID=3154942 RepID=UPI003450D313